MTDEEFAEIRSEMREKYAVHYDEVQQIISDQLPDMPDAAKSQSTVEGSEPEEIAPSTYTPPNVTPSDPKQFTD